MTLAIRPVSTSGIQVNFATYEGTITGKRGIVSPIHRVGATSTGTQKVSTRGRIETVTGFNFYASSALASAKVARDALYNYVGERLELVDGFSELHTVVLFDVRVIIRSGYGAYNGSAWKYRLAAEMQIEKQ